MDWTAAFSWVRDKQTVRDALREADPHPNSSKLRYYIIFHPVEDAVK